VYFTGPFLCQTFSRVLNVKIDQAQLVEGVIGEHLRRSLVHFHAGKRELDFVVGEAGVELKWQEHASPGDFPRRSCSPSTTPATMKGATWRWCQPRSSCWRCAPAEQGLGPLFLEGLKPE